MEELDEEHGGEDGLLTDAKNNKGKLTKASVKGWLAELKGDEDLTDERKMIEHYQSLIEKEGVVAKRVKDAQKALDAQVTRQYAELSINEIKALVVDEKWMATLAVAVQGELDRVSQTLTGRIRQLAERYAMPARSSTAKA